MHSPLEIAKNFIEIGIHKTRLSALKMVILGFFAGMFIGFAGIASTVSSASIQSASVARLVSACVFPAGMAMVLVAGSELFTGNNLIIIALLEKKIKLLDMLKNWFFVYIGNFLGAAFVAFLVVYGNIPSLFSGELSNKIVAAAAARTNQDFVEAFVRGIACNILVCIAVWAAFAAKKVSGKLLMSFWPVMIFVLCGFEHSIADMYFGVAGLLTRSLYAVEESLIAGGNTLSWLNFLWKNLLPVTLGNIVGGAFIVGFGYWAMYLRHTPGFAQTIEAEQEEIDMAEEY